MDRLILGVGLADDVDGEMINTNYITFDAKGCKSLMAISTDLGPFPLKESEKINCIKFV